ncbi:MAG TPA: HWE histidine kinase domain-containing protein [Azospirillaceae bacterium]|nr:HWE histidine kinase domain-containing protein [Azospirillaceae bacterium]
MRDFAPDGDSANEQPFHKQLDAHALADLIEHLPIAVSVTIPTPHRRVLANRLYRSIHLEGDGGVTGTPVPDTGNGGSESNLRGLRARVLETGETHRLTGVPGRSRSGGNPGHWDVEIRPFRCADVGIRGTVTLAIDATDRVNAQAEAAMRAREADYHTERLALAVEATELGLWEWHVQTGAVFWSARQKEIFGLPLSQTPSYEDWLSALHPDDRDSVVAAVKSLMDPASDGLLRLEHRVVRADGTVRRVLGRGRMLYETVAGQQTPVRLLGTVLDITDRWQAEEERQLITRELHHRVKNLFAVAGGMVALTARSARTPDEMAQTLQGRLNAMAHAHELILPATKGVEAKPQQTSLDVLVRTILAPHVGEGHSRLDIQGLDIDIGPNAATGLTLVLHELATNAAKYGSLSVPEGQVRVTCARQDGSVELRWDEMGGPRLLHPPTEEGFGSKLSRRSITGQFGGEIVYEWRQTGLGVRIRFPENRLRT